MEKFNEEELFEKYKESDPIYNLLDGSGEVVGIEITEDNRSVYVIKYKDESMKMVYAQDVVLDENLVVESKITKIITASH